MKEYEYLNDNPNFKKIPIIFSLLIGGFFTLLNETLLNVSLNTLMKEFNISLSSVQWVSTGFMLTMSIIIPISSLIIRWFNTRTLFIGIMSIFSIGTLICATAPTFIFLILGRLIQAIGTGLLLPVIINIFLLVYPPERRGRIMGLFGLVIMFAPAIGPTLSGVIVDYMGWRYLFILVIPFTILSIIIANKYLMNITAVTKPKIDILSIIYSSIGFGGIVFGFSSAGESEYGFLTPSVLLILSVGGICLLLFSMRQLKIHDPLIDIRVFKYPMFTHAVIMYLAVVMIMFGTEIVLPIYIQGPLALTAATAGLILLPGSFTEGLMSPIMGYLYDKFGPKILMIPATIILSIAMYLMSNFNIETPIWIIVVVYIILMLSVSAIIMPVETNGLNQLPKALHTHGTAIMTLLQPISGAIGVSLFISIMNNRKQELLSEISNNNQEFENIALVSGFETVYFVSFGIAIITVLLACFIKK